jgi:uncharacterized protein (TIGR00255 family)
MIRSMTGFGRGEATLGESGVVAAEVRTVNSRHLDLRLRVPRELATAEPELRVLLGRFFGRGQVDLLVRLPAEGALAPQIEIDAELARRYLRAARELGGADAAGPALRAGELLQLPGVVQAREQTLDLDRLLPAVCEAIEAASRAAAAMRAREGGALAGELGERLDRASRALESIEARAEWVGRGLRERLERRLEKLAPELELDPGRLEQEVVLYAARMDVTEEIVRFRSHVAQFRETLESSESVGRKLEFLLQECVREANTIGSKVQDAEIAHAVVDLKTELEKLREQVQNVE